MFRILAFTLLLISVPANAQTVKVGIEIVTTSTETVNCPVNADGIGEC